MTQVAQPARREADRLQIGSAGRGDLGVGGGGREG